MGIGFDIVLFDPVNQIWKREGWLNGNLEEGGAKAIRNEVWDLGLLVFYFSQVPEH